MESHEASRLFDSGQERPRWHLGHVFVIDHGVCDLLLHDSQEFRQCLCLVWPERLCKKLGGTDE